MKNIIKKIFSRVQKNNTDDKSKDISAIQMRQKKEKAIRHVGERYGRAITRLSDT